MSEFKQYRRTGIGEARPYVPGDDLTGVTIDPKDRDERGSPKVGDMIARNPANHGNRWLIEAAYFAKNFEAL